MRFDEHTEVAVLYCNAVYSSATYYALFTPSSSRRRRGGGI